MDIKEHDSTYFIETFLKKGNCLETMFEKTCLMIQQRMPQISISTSIIDMGACARI